MSESVCLTVDRWRKSDIFSKPTLETSHASRTQSLGHGSVLPQALHVWKRAEGGRGHPVRRLCGAVFLTPVPPSSTFHPHSHSPPTDHRCLPSAAGAGGGSPDVRAPSCSHNCHSSRHYVFAILPGSPSSPQLHSRLLFIPLPRVCPSSRRSGLSQTGEPCGKKQREKEKTGHTCRKD